MFTIGGASLTLSSGSRHVKDANHLRETTIESLTVTTEHDAVSTRQLILNNTQQQTYSNTSTLYTTCGCGLNHMTLAQIYKLGMKRVLTQCKRGRQTCASFNLILYMTGSQCSSFRAGCTWSRRDNPRSRRAAAFWTSCKGAMVHI